MLTVLARISDRIARRVLSSQASLKTTLSRVLNSLRGLPPAIAHDDDCLKISGMGAEKSEHEPFSWFSWRKIWFHYPPLIAFRMNCNVAWNKIDFKLRSPSYNDLGQAVIFPNWHWYQQPWNNKEQRRLIIGREILTWCCYFTGFITKLQVLHTAATEKKSIVQHQKCDVWKGAGEEKSRLHCRRGKRFPQRFNWDLCKKHFSKRPSTRNAERR